MPKKTVLQQFQTDLKKLANKEKAKVLARFFKTGPGEYGEGDKFLGVVVPEQRKITKKYLSLSLNDLQQLLKSPWHEERLTALLILVEQNHYADEKTQKNIFDFYLKNIAGINNWDLVDLTASHIVGKYLLNRDRKILYKLSKDKNIWARRVAVIATFTFIRYNQFDDTLKLAEMLLDDKHDLMHKAVGWMLREIGKRDVQAEENFLHKFAVYLPRTALRYAIEKFPEDKRKYYLQQKSI